MNNSLRILHNYKGYLTASERRFLASVSPYRNLTWAQADVVRSISRKARYRYIRGYW